MALLKLRLSVLKIMGRIPKTDFIESTDKTLREELVEFNRFSQSDELKHFLNLQVYVNSGEPNKIKADLIALKYQGSPEQQKEAEYIKLSKSQAIKDYLKLVNSETLQQYRSIELSGKPIRYNELKVIVDSPQYQSQRKQHKKENSDEYQNEVEFYKLKNDSELKKYFKLKNWRPLKNYFEVEGSDLLGKYKELKSYVESSDFKERKEYLLSKNKFEKSEAFQKLQEYKTLEKSEKIVWFFKCQKSTKFDELKSWKLSFHDDFTSKQLDRDKWITRYFWGEALLNKSYSLAADYHWYTENDNFEFNGSVLKIVTKKQQSEGIAWDFKYGFVPKKFDYTSGLISTGQAFRQKQGRFEAKIKVTGNQGVYHAFWLVGDKTIPEIDIIRQKGGNSSSFQGSYFWSNGANTKPQKSTTKIGGINLNSDFYIFSIDWDENRIVWKINGIPYKETTNDLPAQALYLVLSSGVTSTADENALPASMEIDWVRCWEKIPVN